MDNRLLEKIELRTTDNGLSIHLLKLSPSLEGGEEPNIEELIGQLKKNYPRVQLNESLIEWYIDKVITSQKTLTDVTIAVGRIPKSKNSHLLTFSEEKITAEDLVYWDFVDILFNHLDESDLNKKLPFFLLYIKKGGVIATQKNAPDEIVGQSLSGEILHADKNKLFKYVAGDNVFFDEDQKIYVATSSGYVFMLDNKISIRHPYFVSKDKLTLYFINFERIPFSYLSKIDLSTYLLKSRIDMNLVKKDMQLEVIAGEPIILATGNLPEDSTDASIEILVETEMKHSPIEENGTINYREINHFPTVSKDELLAKKILMIKGKEGRDIYGNPLPSRTPKDALLKSGYHTHTEEVKGVLYMYSSSDGRIEYKNGIISVYDQLHIESDIDYKTGNIDTKVNVHINGTVRTGFSIKSEKSIFIKGAVEDNCTIEAGGDLVINGGISGQMNNVTVQGNMSAKFIEGGTIFTKGHLLVHKFLLGANISCQGTISVMGAGLNLNEKGAIIDCIIYLKGLLYCPTIGNDVGQETHITFGYDKNLNAKINNLEETLHKIKQSIEDLNEQSGIDITHPNIHSLIKEFSREKKDKIIVAIQEKNKFDKQYKMISEILEIELEKKRIDILNSAIFVTNKVFPPLHLECDNAKKIIDKIHPPSKYLYSFETKHIERDRFLLGKDIDK